MRQTRGRPRTHNSMIGVRVPKSALKKIDKIAYALSACRSDVIRQLIDKGLNSGFAIMHLRSGRGKRAADRIVAIEGAAIRAAASEQAAKNAPSALTAQAEIKALRDSERWSELVADEADRLSTGRVYKRSP